MILKSYSLIATKSIRKDFYIQPFKILITGGLGFIGSHTAVALIAAGHDVVIVDNLSNSNLGVLNKLKTITGHAYIPFEIVDRRTGDCAVSVAAVNKAESELGWKSTRSLEDMCRDSWGYMEKSRDYS